MPVTVTVVPDTRRPKEHSKYPVKLRVHCKRKMLYPAVFDLTSEDYQKLSAPRMSAELPEIKNELRQIERSAEVVAREIQPFCFSLFEKTFVLQNPLFRYRKQKEEEAVLTKEVVSKGKNLTLLLLRKNSLSFW